MADRVPFIAGNWKMNLDHLQATHLVQKLDWSLRDAKHDYAAVEVAVFPPYTDLRSVQTLVEADKLKLKYGAQDVSRHSFGPFTGQISAEFLTKLGCTYIIVGHSERRQHSHETDEIVNAKLIVTIDEGMLPILCVGEGLEVRRKGDHVPFVLEQVRTGLFDVHAENVTKVTIAYEPVWAIGTGEVASPEDAQEVCGAIRRVLEEQYGPAIAESVRVLYGGSVNAKNIAALMAKDDIDGALVGGASIDPAEFAAICRFREHVTG